MSLAMILTFTGYEEAFAEMSYAEQTSFTVSMENQTLKSVIKKRVPLLCNKIKWLSKV